MAQFSVKLITYDPVIIDAFDRLRKSRKQAAFTHEALKFFLTTEKGVQVLLLMKGNDPVSSSTMTSISVAEPRVEATKEPKAIFQGSASQDSSSDIIASILKD